MACRDAYEIETENIGNVMAMNQFRGHEGDLISTTDRLLFGVNSEFPSNTTLQNNLTEFEWVTKNKLYPNFWGRNITGENCLTKGEIVFLHDKGCKIAAIYKTTDAMETEEQGSIQARKIAIVALELGIPKDSAIFLEISETENVTSEYLKEFIQDLLSEGYTPGFKANTDANYPFDRMYSRGMQEDPALFGQCLIWAVAPSLKEYDRVTTTHLIHPDNWVPYAPSGITRNDIAIWQYGKACHPIHDDAGNETSFNIDLVRNEQVIIDKMF